jgi:hypothetical protein
MFVARFDNGRWSITIDVFPENGSTLSPGTFAIDPLSPFHGCDPFGALEYAVNPQARRHEQFRLNQVRS